MKDRHLRKLDDWTSDLRVSLTSDVGDARSVVFHAFISIPSVSPLILDRMIVDEFSSDRARRKWPRKTNAPGHHPVRVGAWARGLSSARWSLIVGVDVVSMERNIPYAVVTVVAGRLMTNQSLVNRAPSETKVCLPV